MKLFYNPFKKKRKVPIWDRIRELSNFTWKNRTMIDKLDNQLLSLIKKRTVLVNDVLKLKEFKNQIVDKKRIKRVKVKIS